MTCLLTSCAKNPALPAVDECRYRGTLREQGIAGALRHLAALDASDSDVRLREHKYALEVGRRSYTQTRDVAEISRQCGAVPDTGCYHGAVEAFVASTRRVAREEVVRLCDGAPITAESPALRIQCVHGVVHGLARIVGDRVESALASCDGFGAGQDREACYSGVFMQEIEQTGGRPDTDPFAPDPTRQTPFAVCKAIADQYRRACYVQQPTVFLAANGEDVPAAFTTCEHAPAARIVPCYQGVGAWISIFAHWDPDQTSTLCWLADTPFRPWCLDGAIAGMASAEATADRPMALCHSTPPDLRTFCFEALGERIPALYADLTAQESACAMAQDRNGSRSAGAARAWLCPCVKEGNGVQAIHHGDRIAPRSRSGVVQRRRWRVRKRRKPWTRGPRCSPIVHSLAPRTLRTASQPSPDVGAMPTPGGSPSPAAA